MLTHFEVKNFKNFKDNLVFDLSSTKYEFNPECVENGVVKKGLIYGPNGSGKSNLGLAIFDLISHLTEHQFERSHYKNYLNAESKTDRAEFKFNFEFDAHLVEYSYSKKDADLILNETLKINGKQVISYTRGKPIEINLKGTESLNTDLSGTKLSALKYIKNNSRLDNRNVNNKVFNKFFNFINGMLFFRSLDDNNYIGYENGTGYIDEDILKKDHLNEFEIFLNAAGIKCKLKVIKENERENIFFDFGDKSIKFFDAASTGTRALSVFYFWLQRLREGNEVSFVFIDEFDAFYHHKLSALIINELKKIKSQVILTTHNTAIMSNDLLRPDCYFILQGNEVKPIYQFTGKELRLAHNIEKMYRAGAFSV